MAAAARGVVICCRQPRPGRSSAIGVVHTDPPQVAGTSLQSLAGYGLLRVTIKALRRHAAAAFPVVVRTGANMPPHTDAYCCRRETRFVITLGRHLDPKSAVEAVLHEWAHVRAWSHRHDRAIDDLEAGRISDPDFENLVHDAAWGVEFAFCWRVFTGEVLPSFDPTTA
jgi:hypothetical protein